MANPMLVVGGLVAAAVVGVGVYFMAADDKPSGLGDGTAAPAAAPATDGGDASATPKDPLPANAGGGSGAVLANEEARQPAGGQPPVPITHAPDYVCGKKVPMETSPFAVDQGCKYYFCGDDCKGKFEADPMKYLDGLPR